MWRKYKALHLHTAADRTDDTAGDDAPATSELAGDRRSSANISTDRRDDSATRRALTDHEQSCDQSKAQPINRYSTDRNAISTDDDRYPASTDGNRYQQRRAEEAEFTAWLEHVQTSRLTEFLVNYIN